MTTKLYARLGDLERAKSEGDATIYVCAEKPFGSWVEISQQPAASRQPVAEVHPSHLRPAETGNEHWCREVLLYSGNSPHDHGPEGNYRIKLYAAPQPSPARMPLTDAEIDYLAKSVTTTRPGKIAMEFARAIEAAHGILPQHLKDEK